MTQKTGRIILDITLPSDEDGMGMSVQINPEGDLNRFEMAGAFEVAKAALISSFGLYERDLSEAPKNEDGSDVAE